MSSCTSSELIVDSEDDGVGAIPPPPSPHEMADAKHRQQPHQLLSSIGANESVTTSISSSAPSRESITAAIRLVRAKQLAKSKAMTNRVEDLEETKRLRVLQPTPSNSSVATDSSPKKNTNFSSSSKSENAWKVMKCELASL